MAISVKHAFQSAKADGPDSTLVQPSNWNAEHTITAAAGVVLGRNTSGAGAIQELPLAVDTTGNLSLPTGAGYAINGTSVLTATALGSGVVTSSLTSVGTITTGTWNATTIAVNRGGTGATSLTSGYLLKGNGTSAVSASVVYESGGNVGIGVTNPQDILHTAGYIRTPNGAGIKFTDASGTTPSIIAQGDNNIVFYSTDAGGSGRAVWSVLARNSSSDFNVSTTIRCQPTYDNTATGSTVVVTSTGQIRRTSSSIKYKKDVEDLDPSLATNAVDRLRPVYYRTKNPEGDDKATWSHIGLIAEEVHEVEPRLVRYRTAEVIEEQKPVLDENGDPALDDEGNPTTTIERTTIELEVPEPEDVDYARLSVLLLAEIQSLRARVAALESA